jgi:hypothetical protein
MNLWTRLFRRKPAIRDWTAVASFLDANAAFLVNRTMYEYARARAGFSSEKLFRERDFLAAIEAARWTAYPIALANVAELVWGALARAAPDARAELLDAVAAAARDALARYPVPSAVEPEVWTGAPEEVERRVRVAGLVPPKRAIDVPEASFPELFALVPIHPDLRAIDYQAIRNGVRAAMPKFVEEFRSRMDLGALLAGLPGDPSPASRAPASPSPGAPA